MTENTEIKVVSAPQSPHTLKKELQLQADSQTFLQRPIEKVPNINKSLKESYEKGYFKEKRFDYLRQLKQIRKNGDQDSVSSHGGTDDEDFDIKKEMPKRGRKKADSDSDKPDKTQKKKPGRKPKQTTETLEVEKNEETTDVPIKKKRGRPKKTEEEKNNAKLLKKEQKTKEEANTKVKPAKVKDQQKNEEYSSEQQSESSMSSDGKNKKVTVKQKQKQPSESEDIYVPMSKRTKQAKPKIKLSQSKQKLKVSKESSSSISDELSEQEEKRFNGIKAKISQKQKVAVKNIIKDKVQSRTKLQSKDDSDESESSISSMKQNKRKKFEQSSESQQNMEEEENVQQKNPIAPNKDVIKMEIEQGQIQKGLNPTKTTQNIKPKIDKDIGSPNMQQQNQSSSITDRSGQKQKHPSQNSDEENKQQKMEEEASQQSKAPRQSLEEKIKNTLNSTINEPQVNLQKINGTKKLLKKATKLQLQKYMQQQKNTKQEETKKEKEQQTPQLNRQSSQLYQKTNNQNKDQLLSKTKVPGKKRGRKSKAELAQIQRLKELQEKQQGESPLQIENPHNQPQLNIVKTQSQPTTHKTSNQPQKLISVEKQAQSQKQHSAQLVSKTKHRQQTQVQLQPVNDASSSKNTEKQKNKKKAISKTINQGLRPKEEHSEEVQVSFIPRDQLTYENIISGFSNFHKKDDIFIKPTNILPEARQSKEQIGGDESKLQKIIEQRIFQKKADKLAVNSKTVLESLIVFDSSKLRKDKEKPHNLKQIAIVVPSEEDDQLQNYSVSRRKFRYKQKGKKMRKIIVQESASDQDQSNQIIERRIIRKAKRQRPKIYEQQRSSDSDMEIIRRKPKKKYLRRQKSENKQAQ